MALIALVDTKDPKLADLGNGAFLGDVAASNDNALSAGFYVQHKSEKPLVYTYTYDELKIVLEGELHVSEPSSGTTIVAKAGDVLNISNGATLEFNSPSTARIFYGAKRARLE
ncbi:hypothetical protein FA10DRAFT_268247 [Acaromyces ingoldii]|uniref:Ethanolamine utilization protein n=1 Tax=Acaromyces ingoldii TaxID=215250 RepID=A0A316YPR3_9BASI|nr:hypothetical protein FA10DRAFT_268247 [Acaromyces ingoldii]PWN89735.1 hypothetical protein FA10DRAFT_268247 [Acaromyces ingoldii]